MHHLIAAQSQAPFDLLAGRIRKVNIQTLRRSLALRHQVVPLPLVSQWHSLRSVKLARLGLKSNRLQRREAFSTAVHSRGERANTRSRLRQLLCLPIAIATHGHRPRAKPRRRIPAPPRALPVEHLLLGLFKVVRPRPVQNQLILEPPSSSTSATMFST